MIHGLTDKKSVTMPYIATLWKGTPKQIKIAQKATRTLKVGDEYETYGADLENKFRLQPTDQSLIPLIQDHYPANRIKHPKGDYLEVESLNIFCLSEDFEQTFPSDMLAYSASSLVLRCDRHTIYQRRQTSEFNGDKFNQIVEVKEACPLRNAPMGAKCPNGCIPTGDFRFYIQELVLLGYQDPVRLRIHGYSDFMAILGALQQLQDTFGSIKRSPIPAPNGVIPLVLSRQKANIKKPIIDKTTWKRTGKMADGEAWPVKITPHPTYLTAFYNYHQKEYQTLSGASPIPVALPSSENKVLQEFLSACDRIDSEEKLKMLEQWIKSKWDLIKDIENIAEIVDRALIQAEDRLSI